MNIRIIYKNDLLPDDIINGYVSQLIKEFRSRKINSGDLVLCRAGSQLGTIIQWLACLDTGIIPIFIPFDYEFSSFQSFINRVDIKLEVDTKDNIQHVLSEVIVNENKTTLKNISSGSVIHVTSATTGSPKVVLRTKSQLDAEIERYIYHLKFTENDVFLPIIPFYHSFGFISAMLVCMKVGATLVIPDIVLPRNIIESCNLHKVSVLMSVPYFYSKMCDVSKKYQFINKVKFAIASGAPMEIGLQDNFIERFGFPLLQQYGSTETGSLSISEPNDEYNNVGRPFNGVYFNIINDMNNKPWISVSTLQTLGSYISDDGVVKPQAEFIKLGDIGSISESGKLIIYGRGDDVLTISGKKFSKQAIIKVIEKFDGIETADISIMENNNFKELVCEYTGKKKIPYESIINHCKKYLPDYQIPKQYSMSDKIDSSGKKRSWKNKMLK